MGFFSKKVKALFSFRETPTSEEWLVGVDPAELEGGPNQGPELDGDERRAEEPILRRARTSPALTSPALTGRFEGDANRGEASAGGASPAIEAQPSKARSPSLILSPARELGAEQQAKLKPDRVLPSDELSFDPDESIEVPADMVESYSDSHRRAPARQALSQHSPVEQWEEDDGRDDDDSPAPQTVFSLPIQPLNTPYEEEATIAPPSGAYPPPDLRSRRRRRPSQPVQESQKTEVFSLLSYPNSSRRTRFERVLSPVHIPSLQEMSVMMRHWLSECLKQHQEEALTDEKVDELHQVWHGYFELRPDDHQAKLEYGWFMLDFYGKDAAHEYFQSQYESSDVPEKYLYALTSLSYKTGDSLGAYEYVMVLFDKLPEDLQVLHLKLDIECALKKDEEAERTERLIFRQQGLQESVGGY